MSDNLKMTDKDVWAKLLSAAPIADHFSLQVFREGTLTIKEAVQSLTLTLDPRSLVVEIVRGLTHMDVGEVPVETQVLRVNLPYALGPYVIVDGEWCAWREDEDLGVVVKREPWSLLGTGHNLDSAISDFRHEAAELALSMQADAPGELTYEARKMRDSVMRYLPDNG